MTQSRRLHPLERRVLQTIREHELIPPNSTVVVAVSGGVDSLALMHILHALTPRLECTLHIATLDHMLRGEAGAADAAFVAAEAAKLGLACTVGARDVRALAKAWHQGIEAAARRARYEFLATVARANRSIKVITAHHADDQAETVLMRIIRGTSLTGLAAMSYRSSVPYFDNYDPWIDLYRPLLGVFRVEIEAYAKERGLAPRIDASNDSLDHTRNRIRHQVMPLLREFNPKVERALAQLADAAQLDNENFYRALSDLRNRDVIVPENKPSRYKIHRAEFTSLQRAIQARALTQMFEGFGKADLTHRHITTCIVAIHRAVVGKRVQLPHGVTLLIDYDYAYLERDESAEGGRAVARPYRLLSAPGLLSVPIPSSTFSSHLRVSVTAQMVSDKVAEDTVDRTDTARRVSTTPSEPPLPQGEGAGGEGFIRLPTTATVTLRGRRDGDRFAPKGMDGHTQKIKQWMIDRKIPAVVRDRVPLLDVDGQIAAILWGDTWMVAEPFRADRALGEGEQYVRFTLEAWA